MSIKTRRERKLASRAKRAQPQPSVENCHVMVTRQKSRQACQVAVFSTTELLEKVLETLPMYDLANARLVSTEWNEIVTKSVKLQQCLFLKPKRDNVAWINEDGTDSLRPHIRGSARERDLAWARLQKQCIPVVINPVLLARDPRAVAGLIPIRDRFRSAETLTMTKLPDLRRYRPKSGDNMFLTQPPVKEVKIEVDCSRPKEFKTTPAPAPQDRWIDIKNPLGVTWKDIRQGIRGQLTPKGQVMANRGSLKLIRETTKVWAIGVVAYSAKEAEEVDSGRMRNEEEDFEEARWRVV